LKKQKLGLGISGKVKNLVAPAAFSTSFILLMRFCSKLGCNFLAFLLQIGR
jgi:hypothetical protein